jgi:hypothetical protein
MNAETESFEQVQSTLIGLIHPRMAQGDEPSLDQTDVLNSKAKKWVVDNTPFYLRAHKDIKVAAQKMKDTLEWRERAKPDDTMCPKCVVNPRAHDMVSGQTRESTFKSLPHRSQWGVFFFELSVLWVLTLKTELCCSPALSMPRNDGT